MIDNLFSGSLTSMEAALDVRALRHKLLASNIANAETPGYRALDVDFEATMRELLEHPLEGRPGLAGDQMRPSRSLAEALHIVGDDASSIGNAQNTVDLEQQMAHLEENAMMFQLATRLVARRFQGLARVIEEGGRRG
jgi:flagellar basal-body rod protein FlgB